VAAGDSLIAWTRIFPFADIYGIDDKPETKVHHPRVNFVSRDINDFSFSADYWPWKETFFDLIIDDGSHQEKEILAAWRATRQRCRGIYVIEDVSWDIVPKIMDTIRGESNVNSVIQTSKDNGSRCIVSSFDDVITWG